MLIMMFIITSTQLYSIKLNKKHKTVIPSDQNIPISQIPMTPLTVPNVSGFSSYNK